MARMRLTVPNDELGQIDCIQLRLSAHRSTEDHEH